MRAAVARRIDATDPLSALEVVDDWPEPEPPAGHTVVTMAATTVNMHDYFSILGVGVRPEMFPMVLGCDITGWDPEGNEVITSGSFADPDAGDGDETFDPRRALISEKFPGSFAERTIVPRRNLIPKPSFLSWHEAACLNVGWSTAYRLLFTRARAIPGETVLVQGAGGGVSSAVIAMARAAGLYVFATSRSEAKRAKALEIGAHAVVETGGRLPEKVDIVVDTVGEATWGHSLRSVKPGGRIVTSGATTGGDMPTDLNRIFYQQISIIGATSSTRGETIRLVRFMEASGLRPFIDSVYPFESIHDAFARSQAPDVFGKVVVEMPAYPR